MRVAVVMGTRPDAIKLAPVVHQLATDPRFNGEVWLTGQHRGMLDQVIDSFGVEAGVRSGALDAPFPEEANRRLVSVPARWHFAPTGTAASALRREGVDPEAIHVTGNTVVDTLLHVGAQDPPAGFGARFGTIDRLVLATVHRRENHGPALESICDGLAALANEHPDVQIILPVHPNPNVTAVVRERLGPIDTIMLTDPLDYPTMVHLLKRVTLVVTDSGGLQEEAPVFGVPVLVTRTTTERPEGIEAGTAKLIGTSAESLRSEAGRLLDDPAAHAAMARAVSPYGDGSAASRIVEVLGGESNAGSVEP